MLVAREEIHIPVEADAKTCLRLIVLSRPMGKVHHELEPLSQDPEKRRVILHRMGRDDGKAHRIGVQRGRPARSAAKRSKIPAKRLAIARAS